MHAMHSCVFKKRLKRECRICAVACGLLSVVSGPMFAQYADGNAQVRIEAYIDPRLESLATCVAGQEAKADTLGVA